MSWDDGLTGTARDIAATNDNPLRVMAGPGTGKSFAMKRRVARLLESGQDPRRVLAVTFTRNAAASLVSDLHALGIDDCERVCGRNCACSSSASCASTAIPRTSRRRRRRRFLSRRRCSPVNGRPREAGARQPFPVAGTSRRRCRWSLDARDGQNRWKQGVACCQNRAIGAEDIAVLASIVAVQRRSHVQ